MSRPGYIPCIACQDLCNELAGVTSMTLVLSGVLSCPCFYSTNACNTVRGMNGSYALTGSLGLGWTGLFPAEMAADYWGEELSYAPCGPGGCSGGDTGTNPLDLQLWVGCSDSGLLIQA